MRHLFSELFLENSKKSSSVCTGLGGIQKKGAFFRMPPQDYAIDNL